MTKSSVSNKSISRVITEFLRPRDGLAANVVRDRLCEELYED